MSDACKDSGSGSGASSAASTHFEVVIAFRERENAEKAVAQIEWAMNYARLEPFEMEIQEVAGDV